MSSAQWHPDQRLNIENTQTRRIRRRNSIIHRLNSRNGNSWLFPSYHFRLLDGREMGILEVVYFLLSEGADCMTVGRGGCHELIPIAACYEASIEGLITDST